MSNDGPIEFEMGDVPYQSDALAWMDERKLKGTLMVDPDWDTDPRADEVEAQAQWCARQEGVKATRWYDFMDALAPLRHHNMEMYLHTMRVGVLAYRLAKEERENVSPRFCLYGGCGHDVGKCSIPNDLLDSKDLQPEEFEVIKDHARAGYEALATKGFLFSGYIAGLHHRYRPTGYGIDLSREARPWLSTASLDLIRATAEIVMVADFYDALTTRVNNKGLLKNPGDRDEQRAVMEGFFPSQTERIERLFA